MSARDARETLLREELANVAAQIPESELRVLLLIARRVAQGKKRYGSLAIDEDSRDFLSEGTEELVDGCFYFAADALKKAIQRRAVPAAT